VIRKLFVFSVLLVSGSAIYGQVADSATAGIVPLTVGGFFSFFDSGYQSSKVAGFGAVLDYSPLFSGSLGLEGESRWLIAGGPHGFSEYHYLVGPRYRFRQGNKYQPYVKFLVGAGEVNFPYGLAHGGYFALSPGGGLDIAVSEHWRMRADYELQFWPSAFGIPGNDSGSVHPNGVSVGFTYRLFRSRYQLPSY